MKYFRLEELTRSTTATQRGIDNTPDPRVIENLTYLVEHLLDPIREEWGSPITVTSGYRSVELNKAVGGVPTSQHVLGQAVDITVGSKTLNAQLFALIRDSGAVFDQLIDEKNYSWLHISLKASGNRNQLLHLK